jgi:hypothetical protein
MTQRAISLTPMRVTPGARLARDVLRGDGQVLLAAGAELDREAIAHLFERGVELVWITVDDPRDEATRTAQWQVTEEHLRLVFRGPSNSVRDELRDALIAHRRQQVQ